MELGRSRGALYANVPEIPGPKCMHDWNFYLVILLHGDALGPGVDTKLLQGPGTSTARVMITKLLQ